jgi:phage host-nuclease inhibitor protein Gam
MIQPPTFRAAKQQIESVLNCLTEAENDLEKMVLLRQAEQRENKRLREFLNDATASIDAAIRDKARALYAEISPNSKEPTE